MWLFINSTIDFQCNCRRKWLILGLCRSVSHHNRSFDLVSDEGGSSNVAKSMLRTVYAYSSSDESLNASFSSSSAAPVSAKVVPRGLRRGTAGDSASSAAATDADDAEELVETLCEAKMRSSTPSLAPSAFSNKVYSWSNGTAPRLRKRQTTLTQSTLSGLESIWSSPIYYGTSNTDDPEPGSIVGLNESASTHQGSTLTSLHSLQTQAATLKTTLSQMEAHFSNSNRDMGSLQDNLKTVQNAATNVADKVVKMQSQVNAMEKQIVNAVKVITHLRARSWAWKTESVFLAARQKCCQQTKTNTFLQYFFCRLFYFRCWCFLTTFVAEPSKRVVWHLTTVKIDECGSCSMFH